LAGTRHADHVTARPLRGELYRVGLAEISEALLQIRQRAESRRDPRFPAGARDAGFDSPLVRCGAATRKWLRDTGL